MPDKCIWIPIMKPSLSYNCLNIELLITIALNYSTTVHYVAVLSYLTKDPSKQSDWLRKIIIFLKKITRHTTALLTINICYLCKFVMT